jgi:hypothetical protein
MFSMQYLQIIATLMITGEITLKLSKDMYKTRKKQKTREGLLKLNWRIPNIPNKIEKRLFRKEYTLSNNLLENNFSGILKWIYNPQTKYSIEASGGIIIIIIIIVVVLGIILTGIMLKKSLP